MIRRMIGLFLILCSLGTTTVTAGDDDGMPDWVPWTVVGSVIVGGVAYLIHKHHQDAPIEKTPKQKALDLIAYVSTDEEHAELGALTTEEEVKAFLDRFFEVRDPSSETPENEFRSELVARYLYANKSFIGGDEGWKSDRGRVCILYGLPSEVLNYPFVNVSVGHGISWKAAELWRYETPAGTKRLPPLLQDAGRFMDAFRRPPPMLGQTLFLFVRRSEVEDYDQVFSTEEAEVDDPVIYEAEPLAPGR